MSQAQAQAGEKSVNQLSLNINFEEKSVKKVERHKFDRYDSPHWFLTHLLKYIKIEGIVGEPCKGSGNLSDLFPYINGVDDRGLCWTSDIDPSVIADFHLDAADPKCWGQFPGADWIITNPPFNAAFPILRNAYNHARVGVVMFLRLSFQEPTEKRAQWLHDHPRHLDLVYPRFKFRKDKDSRSWKTDSVPIIAMVWRKDTDKQLSPISIPQSHILGWHDTPLNAPSFEEQIQIIKEVQNAKS